MSDRTPDQAPSRAAHPASSRRPSGSGAQGPGPGRGPFGGGMVGQKAMTFGPSAKRLVRRLRAGAVKAAAVVAARRGQRRADVGRPADPRPRHRPDLRRAASARGCPRASPRRRPSEALRAPGDDSFADMLASMDVVPGQGVDFAAVGRRAAAGARGLRRRVGARLAAGLPAQRRRAEHRPPDARATSRTRSTGCRWATSTSSRAASCSSRVTNDIDNVSQTLQQTMSQLLTSLLTVVAVLAMMFWISPLLALIALVVVPLSLVVDRDDHEAVAGPVRRAVAPHRPAQRAHRGDLHRPRAGQGVRPAGARSSRPSPSENDELYRGVVRRAVRLRPDHAGDDVHREPQLRRDRRRRRPAGRLGHDDASATCRRSSSTPGSSPSR